jgi:uncharacterized surface protein with fasciclin (FAS1) repeats
LDYCFVIPYIIGRQLRRGKMFARLCRVLLVFGLVVAITGVSASPLGAQGGTDSMATILLEDGRFSTAYSAMLAAGIESALADCDADPLTALVPTDEAFTASLTEFGIEGGSLLSNVPVLTALLNYHLVDGAQDAAALAALDGTDLTTLSGEDLKVALDGTTVTLESGGPHLANVDPDALEACNGVIYPIDTMLVPPTIGAALGIPTRADLANTGTGSDAMAIIALAIVAAGAMVVTAGRRLRFNH